MKIFTGRSRLLEGAMIDQLRASMDNGLDAHIVVVPKQLTLQTERTLLKALGLQGSFQLQVYSPERLCGRIFDEAGAPEGERVDDRGRVMLVRTAIRACGDGLKLYRGAEHRRGFPDRCARQLELNRQAELTPDRLRACAEEAGGLLALKLRDLAAIQERYESLIEGRFQDGESEFNHAVARSGGADFLRHSDISFFGFDTMPPTLHRLIGAVGAACPETHVFLPLENDENAPDSETFASLRAGFERLCRACADAGAQTERVPVEAPTGGDGEIRFLSRALFAYPARPWPDAPGHVQMASFRNPMEECRFAAALCRRLCMKNGWRWNDFLILCRDMDGYRQPLREAFRACGVPLFLSGSRPAARHALSECLLSAIRMASSQPQPDDAQALLRCGFMPVDADEADRLQNHIVKYGLRPAGLLRPLKRGTEAEIQALEPVRDRFTAPLLALKNRLRRSETLRDELAALFHFLEDIGAAERLEGRLNALIDAGLRDAAGEEAQVWNRMIGALDQMAALMGEEKLPASELGETLSESLEAAVIKPLPQSDDAVYAQPTDRIVARPVRALLMLGETDQSGADPDGLFNAPQVQIVSRLADAYLGPDGDELSRMRRFYIKSALEMTGDYLCVTWPMGGMDNSACHPGQLVDAIRSLLPKMPVRGGVTGDEKLARLMRSSPEAAVACAARALSSLGEGVPLPDNDIAAIAGLAKLAPERPELALAFERLHAAMNRGAEPDRLNPATARALYGDLRRQSVTRLELFARCPFAYFTRYGLRPERIEPYGLNPRDEGVFFHEAVRVFLMQSRDDLNRIDIPAAEARMDRISDELLRVMAEQGPLGDSAVALAERRRLKATARTCAAVLAGQMQGSRFQPAELEADFGREDGPARLVVDAESVQCVLEGRIDRIDEWSEGGYLRVIDYKRGGKTLNLDAVYHGLSLQLPVYLAAAMRRRGDRSAGVYYFNLDEGILTLQSTDPHDVEKERRDAFRLDGLAVNDVDVLAAQSPDFQEILKVRVSKEGALYKNALATDQKGFEALTGHAMKMAGAHLDAICGGEASVAPAAHRSDVPCDHCDWRCVCLYDPRLDAACVRRFPKMKADDVMERVTLRRDAVPPENPSA